MAQRVDEAGFTMLHREALAGNLGLVKFLVAYGADVGARTPSGRTASELARGIGWPEIADYLDGLPQG
jgi:ankyrin repeat protein